MRKPILFIALLCFLFSCKKPGDFSYKSISSGSPGGIYYEIADSIKSWLENSNMSDSFWMVNSTGSLENMERLRNGMADFAIVQRDVANRAYFDRNNPYKQMEIVMPLFPEGMQILVNGYSGILTIHQLDSLIRTHHIKSIAADGISTVTYQTAVDVFAMMGIAVSDSMFDTHSLTENVKKFNSGKIDCIVYYTTFPSTRLQYITDSIPRAIVSFDRADVNFLTKHISFVDGFHFKQPYHFIASDDSIYTIGTWTFLMAQNGALASIEKSMHESAANIILDHLLSPSDSMHTRNISGNISMAVFKKTYVEAGPDFFQIEKKNGAYEVVNPRSDMGYVTRGLPVASEMKSILYPSMWKRIYSFGKYIIIVICILFAVILFFWYRPKALNYTFWLKAQRYVFAVLVLFALFLGAERIIYLRELAFSRNYSVTSPIIELGYLDRVLWLLVMSFTGYEQQIFPYDNVSKSIIGLGSIFTYIFLFLAFVQQLVREANAKSRREGYKPVHWQNHIIITGWNQSAPEFLVNLLKATRPQNTLAEKCIYFYKWLMNGMINALNILKRKFRKDSQPFKLFKILHQFVLVHPDLSEILQRNKILRLELEYGKRFRYINGRANESAVLESANAHLSSEVVHILRDEYSLHEEINKFSSPLDEEYNTRMIGQDAGRAFFDNKTLLDARNINSYCKQKMPEVKEDAIYNIAVFYNNPPSRTQKIIPAKTQQSSSANEFFIDDDINEVVDRDSILGNLVANCMLYDGSLEFLREMVTIGGWCDIFMIDLSDKSWSSLWNKSFNQLYRTAVDKDILVLGIRKTFFKKPAEDHHQKAERNKDEIADELIETSAEMQIYFGEGKKFEDLTEEIDNELISLKLNGTNHQFIVSPPESGDKQHEEYRTKRGDKLYVIAKNRSQLRQLRNLNYDIPDGKMNQHRIMKPEFLTNGKNHVNLILYNISTPNHWKTIRQSIENSKKKIKKVYIMNASRDYCYEVQPETILSHPEQFEIIKEEADYISRGMAKQKIQISKFLTEIISSDECFRFVLMPETDSLAADEEVLLTLMKIYDQFRKELININHKFICVLNHYNYIKSFQEFKNTEVICLPEIVDGIVIQSVLYPGFSHLLNEVLGIGCVDDLNNELVVVDAGHVLQNIDKNHDSYYNIAVATYDYSDSILLGIIRSDLHENHLKVPRKYARQQISQNSNNSIIINPPGDIKHTITVKKKDRLIFLRNKTANEVFVKQKSARNERV